MYTFQGVMSFAELSQSIEVVTNDGFVMPVTDGFPISRSEYRKWTNEIEPYIAKPVTTSRYFVKINPFLPSECCFFVFFFESVGLPF